jgi:hypothetical protein
MMRYLFFGVIIGLMILFLVGCSKGKEITGDEKTAKEYVEALGYKITSYKDQVNKYTLDSGAMDGTLNQQIWSVQKMEPDEYFGKEIVVYGFIVSKHPLEKIYKSKTNVSIMLSEGKVIGGTSFPADNGKNRLIGAPYSLEGKTLEEVTGLTYKEWTENWKKKWSGEWH